MFGPFREILTLPGAWKFSIPGFFARLPISMISLGTVVLLSYTSGSYGIAGAVAAAFMIARALCSPTLARFVDRHGQARVMAPAVVVHCVALAGLIVAALLAAPAWVLFVAAIVAGAAVGSVGSLVRARWVLITRSPAQLHTAFSWEAMVDEMVFMFGPILVTGLAAAFHPSAGLIAAFFAVAGGSLILYSQRRTEPEPQPSSGAAGGSVLRLAAVIVVIVMFVFAGSGLGAVDVITVAYAREHGVPGLAGVLLAMLALGSLLAGFFYGSIRWKSHAGVRLVATVALLAVMSVGLPASGNAYVLGLALFGIGIGVAPTIIGGNAVVQSYAKQGQLTEALAWISTALGIGISIGSAVAGEAVDRFDAKLAFLVVTGFSAAALLIGVCGIKPLSRRPQSAPASADSTESSAGAGGASDTTPPRVE